MKGEKGREAQTANVKRGRLTQKGLTRVLGEGRKGAGSDLRRKEGKNNDRSWRVVTDEKGWTRSEETQGEYLGTD